ncbi:MAG: hypothetical protein L3K08_00740 [Thermoplasmata archaeon]|nr:hypothetical protein [Thermoplasmata archaeon]
MEPATAFLWNRYLFNPPAPAPAMGGYGESPEGRTYPSSQNASNRSHVAGPIAIVLLFVGILFGTYSLLIPALLGLFLLAGAGTLLSMRVNPFSMGFYLPTKPSFTAIAVVALVAVMLLSLAWALYKSGTAPILPRHWP